MVFPGTGLYRILEEKGIVDDHIWEEKVEDIPWFQMDRNLDLQQVKAFGECLRSGFYEQVHKFALNIQLVDRPELYPYHADFLARLAMTFSHGEYAGDPRVKEAQSTAQELYRRAMEFYPHSRIFLGQAMMHQKNRSFVKAVEILEKGLEIHPRDKSLILCMGVSLMNLGKFKQALSCLSPLGDTPDVAPYVAACRARL